MNGISVRSVIVITLIAGLITACQTGTERLKEGMWRGTFTLHGNDIPFMFEVKGKHADSTSVFLINGTDRFELKNITCDKDSVSIPIDLFDVVLKGKLTQNRMEGYYVKTVEHKQIAKIPFKAEYGNFPRFPTSNEPPAFSLAGTWDVKISSGGNIDQTVGNFNQNGSILTGSILELTGDYRFFEGVVQGKKFMLSAFGGATPYLIKGEFLSDSTFSGEFITVRQISGIEGKRNPQAKLPDPNAVSHLKEGHSTIEFSFPDTEGKQVSLSDPKYKGKVVVVLIMGSWCSNCLDENTFLSSWYKANRERGIEIIGLGFERTADFESAKKALSTLRNRLGIDYEILFAGKSGSESESKALPALKGIDAFPTTIFIDKKGEVRQIHTGFSGPATGKFFEEFKRKFNETIDQLAEER